MSYSRLPLLKKRFFHQVLEFSYNYQSGRKTADGSELKLEVVYNASWNTLDIREYKVKWFDYTNCEVTTIKERIIDLNENMKTQADFDKVSKEILDWMTAICTQPAPKRESAMSGSLITSTR